MQHDLLFHITTKENWKKYSKSGNYEPESLEEEGFIHCSTGDQVQETANTLFSDRDEILLLIIDGTMFREDIKYERDEESGQKFPHLYCSINTNAIIDKISVKAEDDGTFDISVTTS